jgi:hypothetical protein
MAGSQASSRRRTRHSRIRRVTSWAPEAMGHPGARVLTDTVDGRFRILSTRDGGRDWSVLLNAGMPAALPGEAGFAVSVECLTTFGHDAWFGRACAPPRACSPPGTAAWPGRPPPPRSSPPPRPGFSSWPSAAHWPTSRLAVTSPTRLRRPTSRAFVSWAAVVLSAIGAGRLPVRCHLVPRTLATVMAVG